MARVNSSPTEIVKSITPADQIVKEAKKDTQEQETELKKPSKTIEKKIAEKKSAAV